MLFKIKDEGKVKKKKTKVDTGYGGKLRSSGEFKVSRQLRGAKFW